MLEITRKHTREQERGRQVILPALQTPTLEGVTQAVETSRRAGFLQLAVIWESGFEQWAGFEA